jgi:hypothetical protein
LYGLEVHEVTVAGIILDFKERETFVFFFPGPLEEAYTADQRGSLAASSLESWVRAFFPHPL